jgi:hypothetical protein
MMPAPTASTTLAVSEMTSSKLIASDTRRPGAPTSDPSRRGRAS